MSNSMLDADGPDTLRLSVTAARELGEAALQRIGYSGDEAAIITDQLIDNALCGYRFASLTSILTIADDARTQRPRKPVRIIRETLVSALVDGGNNVGYITAFAGAGGAGARHQSVLGRFSFRRRAGDLRHRHRLGDVG